MNAADIIKVACDFIGREEVAAEMEEKNLSSQNQKIVDCLLRCLNLVQNEVATEYIPLIKIEEVKPVDFKVDYSSLTRAPIEILSARDKFGRSLRFKAMPEHIVVFSNYAKLKYSYLPKDIISLDQEIEEELVPIRIYAYGVAREYLLLQSLSDDADIWENRFKDSIEVFARKKHDAVIPSRRWL